LLNGDQTPGVPTTLNVLEEVYGKDLRFPFNVRDRIFYTARFRMGRDFFEYFNPKVAYR